MYTLRTTAADGTIRTHDVRVDVSAMRRIFARTGKDPFSTVDCVEIVQRPQVAVSALVAVIDPPDPDDLWGVLMSQPDQDEILERFFREISDFTPQARTRRDFEAAANLYHALDDLGKTGTPSETSTDSPAPPASATPADGPSES